MLKSLAQYALLSEVLDVKSKSASKQCAQPVGPEVCYAANFTDMSSDGLFGLMKLTLDTPQASVMTVDTYLEAVPNSCDYDIEIHPYWPYDYQSVQVGAACSTEFLGGVYDPTLACTDPNSANTESCGLLKRNTQDFGCMYGDFSCQRDAPYVPDTETTETAVAPFIQGFCTSSSRDPWASISVRCTGCASSAEILACAPLRPCAGGKKHALGIKDLLLHDTLTGLLGSKDTLVIQTLSQLAGKTDDLISETVMLLTGGAGAIADTLTNLLAGKELLVSNVISEFVLAKEAPIGEHLLNKESVLLEGVLGGILNKDGAINESLQGLLAKVGLDH